MRGRHHYEPCPNGCDGETPCVWDNDANAAVIDDKDNSYSHEWTCPPLTEEQREAIMDAATLVMSDPAWWVVEYHD